MQRRIALAAAFLAAVFAVSTAAAQSFPPHRFFGNVTVNGQPAAAGTQIRALIGGVECGSGSVTTPGEYRVDVQGVTLNPMCGRNGMSSISFQVGTATAGQTATYRDGGFEQLNLSVGGAAQPSPTAAPVATPTPAATAAPTATPRPATPAPTPAAPTAAPATATPRPVTPAPATATPRPATPAPVATARPQAPAGPATAPKPQAPAAPAAAPATAPRPAAPAAAPVAAPAAAPAQARPVTQQPAALPRTGTGLQADNTMTAGWMLGGLAIVALGLGGTGLALARRRSR